MEQLDPIVQSPKPTEIPELEVVPVTDEVLTSEAFKRFAYTGYNIKIKLPFAKTSGNALFAINTCGYIPNFAIQRQNFPAILTNMTPVQAMPEALDIVEISQAVIPIPIIGLYNSHRFVQGSVGVNLRITSNTSQSGNWIISQCSGAQQLLYGSGLTAEPYEGLYLSNMNPNSTSFQQSGVALWDVSLNRNISITTKWRQTLPATDLMQWMLESVNATGSVISQRNNIVAEQFAGNWLLFTPQGDFPNTQGNEITISVWFDWSQIKFGLPGLPILPPVIKDKAAQILLISETINHRKIADITIKDAASWFTALKWLPGKPKNKKLPKEVEENKEVETKQ